MNDFSSPFAVQVEEVAVEEAVEAGEVVEEAEVHQHQHQHQQHLNSPFP
jgi:hypothetical protein